MTSPNMILRGMRLDTPEAHEAVRLGEIHSRTHRKYTLMLLDEAVRVANEVGPTEAARITGVNKESINKHAQRQRKADGFVFSPTRPSKYSPAIKSKVVADAMRYRQHTKDSWDDCFGRAAVNNGLDKKAGKSIYCQYRQGTLQ